MARQSLRQVEAHVRRQTFPETNLASYGSARVHPYYTNVIHLVVIVEPFVADELRASVSRNRFVVTKIANFVVIPLADLL